MTASKCQTNSAALLTWQLGHVNTDCISSAAGPHVQQVDDMRGGYVQQRISRLGSK